MEVLNSSKAFREHYTQLAGDVFDAVEAAGKGGAVAGGVVGTAAAAVGTAAAHASVWSTFASWPVIGSFAAGKATAAGVAAATAVAGSAVVVVPAVLIGGGVAYALYQKRQKKAIQKGTDANELANAFARIACLPMLALAVSICQTNPANVEGVRGYLNRELGAWGYSEQYIQAGFDEALRHSPEAINGHYEWAMRQLESGTTEGIGATPRELPRDAVRNFAEEFRRNFEFCIG